LFETQVVEKVEAMKEQSRRVYKLAEIVNPGVGKHANIAWDMVILSVLMCLCLGMGGCDAQEGTTPVISDTMNNDSEVFSSQHPVPKSSDASGSSPAGVTSLPRIAAFGDSLTAGFGVPPDQSYPAQLENLLQEKGYQYEVINAGVSGETSAGGVRRVEWILKTQPTIVILELGANDGLRGLPLQQTYANLHSIIKRLKEEGVIVVLAGMRIPVNYGKEYTEEFYEMYQRLAREFSVPLIPFFLEGVAARPDLNQGDGIHPTAEGYTLVMQNVWRTLKPILQEVAGDSETRESHKT
jgi:acyl-CoA thioesterase-1